METFRARPGLANTALVGTAAVGGGFILSLGIWKCVATGSPMHLVVAALGLFVGFRNAYQLVQWRTVLQLSEEGLSFRYMFGEPRRAAWAVFDGLSATTWLFVPAIEFRVRHDDAVPWSGRLRLLRAGYDWDAIRGAIERLRPTGAVAPERGPGPSEM